MAATMFSLEKRSWVWVALFKTSSSKYRAFVKSTIEAIAKALPAAAEAKAMQVTAVSIVKNVGDVKMSVVAKAMIAVAPMIIAVFIFRLLVC